jgi:hypothetical protein
MRWRRQTRSGVLFAISVEPSLSTVDYTKFLRCSAGRSSARLRNGGKGGCVSPVAGLEYRNGCAVFIAGCRGFDAPLFVWPCTAAGQAYLIVPAGNSRRCTDQGNWSDLQILALLSDA